MGTCDQPGGLSSNPGTHSQEGENQLLWLPNPLSGTDVPTYIHKTHTHTHTMNKQNKTKQFGLGVLKTDRIYSLWVEVSEAPRGA